VPKHRQPAGARPLPIRLRRLIAASGAQQAVVLVQGEDAVHGSGSPERSRSPPDTISVSSSRSYSARPGVPYLDSLPRLAHFLMVASETPTASAASCVGTVRLDSAGRCPVALCVIWTPLTRPDLVGEL
jgi:hypothetical protein